MTKNPFRFRASEQATVQDQFLSLVGPDALDLLPQDLLWDRLVIIESAPGAGKTTIMRLFTPGSLSLLHRIKDQDSYRPLSVHLRRLGVLGDEGPSVIGVLISCREQYATIEDLPIDNQTSIRWFFGLLDARVTLRSLRSILTLNGFVYPDDAHRIEFLPNEQATLLPTITNGAELYTKASDREQRLTASLNSLLGVSDVSSDLLNGLQFPNMLVNSDLVLDGSPLKQRILLMFDDVHELTTEQRRVIRRDLERRELNIGRWIAQRSPAVEPIEPIDFARTEGRDYQEVRIEEWARITKKGQRFFSLLDVISDRRVAQAQIGVDNLASCLLSTLTTDHELARATKARKNAKQSAIENSNNNAKYVEWIDGIIDAEHVSLNPLDCAIDWRKLSIAIRQKQGRKQLQMEIPFSFDELKNWESSSINTAAELFLCKEFGLPYYYGVKRIKQLSSWNIEQFLRVAGDLFEQVLASVTLSRGGIVRLTASQQDTLVRAVSRQRLAALPKEVPFGVDVQRLIMAIGEYCALETFRPTAPYAPGVTGVGISEQDLARLRDASSSPGPTLVQRLSRALASAIANNTLEVRHNVKVKGGTWTVFFLNRLYCPAFDLPLEYSGYKERVGIDQLASWNSFGFGGQSPRLH